LKDSEPKFGGFVGMFVRPAGDEFILRKRSRQKWARQALLLFRESRDKKDAESQIFTPNSSPSLLLPSGSLRAYKRSGYNDGMRSLKTDVTGAVEHLPQGSVLTLEQVPWEAYEEVLEKLQEWPGLRTTYDAGRLDVVTTSQEHERRKEFISLLVWTLADALNIEVEAVGGATQKRKRDLRGTEPDASFYIGHLERTIGRRELNLTIDAPPDLVVEIDKSNQSLRKFPIYAAFGVPEIWRYFLRQKKAGIYHLAGETYVEIPASRFFPILISSVLSEFAERSASEGQMAAIKAFRRWINTLSTE
jgi:Uma2 family endonuclease